MPRGTHGEKIIAALESTKLPSSDKPRLEVALQKYDEWVSALDSVDAPTVDELIEKMIDLLNSYKFYIDVDLIFDSPEDFLYRQKGQLKLDNTVIEEFLPIFVRKCIIKEFGVCDVDIGSQTATFSSAYFASSLSSPSIGGGLSIKTKDQDFSMSRKLYLRSSYTPTFDVEKTVTVTTHLGYVMAELKTNLDKTMYQEASATAHDIKLAVTGAKYYLLCDFLDMTPISTATTDIDEISTGKVIVTETARKVVRAIEPSDIVRVFLENKQVDEPIEYIKRICSATSANYPIYFFIQRASIITSDAISLVKSTTSRGVAKGKLIERLEGKVIPQNRLPSSATSAGVKKECYRQQWLTGSIPETIEDVGYCIDALFCLSKEDFAKHDQYIRATMLRIYNDEYEKSSSLVASNIRKAICRIDEAIYLGS